MHLDDDIIDKLLADPKAFAALSEAERGEIEAYLNARIAAMDPVVLLARAKEMLAYLEGIK